MSDVDSAYQITWLVRRLFRALAQRADETLVDLGISAADRAVMEFLNPNESLSVPDIAERYSVSRQHIQVTVNGLLDAGLLEARANPRHKRSSLIALTAKGRAMFRTIKARDAKAISKLFSNIKKKDRQVTQATLVRLLKELN